MKTIDFDFAGSEEEIFSFVRDLVKAGVHTGVKTFNGPGGNTTLTVTYDDYEEMIAKVETIVAIEDVREWIFED